MAAGGKTDGDTWTLILVFIVLVFLVVAFVFNAVNMGKLRTPGAASSVISTSTANAWFWINIVAATITGIVALVVLVKLARRGCENVTRYSVAYDAGAAAGTAAYSAQSENYSNAIDRLALAREAAARAAAEATRAYDSALAVARSANDAGRLAPPVAMGPPVRT